MVLSFKMELSAIVSQNVLMFIHQHLKQVHRVIMEQELSIKEAFLQLHHANVIFLN
jgi:hypothetical protein